MKRKISKAGLERIRKAQAVRKAKERLSKAVAAYNRSVPRSESASIMYASKPARKRDFERFAEIMRRWQRDWSFPKKK